MWEEVKRPEGKVLIPGVIAHTTAVVEHPETVAERIATYARLVGRERVMAGRAPGLRAALASLSSTRIWP